MDKNTITNIVKLPPTYKYLNSCTPMKTFKKSHHNLMFLLVSFYKPRPFLFSVKNSSQSLDLHNSLD